MIKVADGRGENSMKLNKINRKKVKEYFILFPGSTIRRCSCDIGLSTATVSKHVKAIQKEA